MVVGESKRNTNIMDGIENTGDVRLHDHRLRLKQRFDIVRKLGQGTYGKVQLGINKKTGQEVAIKTIKKCKIESEADLIRIRREVQIMSSVRHPNIVHIYEVFENSEKMILVMEYCSGGELYDYLSQKKVLEEEEARRLFRQIATAVYYCHIHKICHRDLKLENVLLDDTGSAKIADFGLSNVFKETSLLSTFCGSPLYASPEIVKGTPYIGPEVDCWSLGVLLYTLVYGAMPFDGSNFKRLVRQISNGDYYEPKSPSTASPLIRDMLTVEPLKRADIAYICDHSWVNSGYEISCLDMAEALAAETPVRLDLLLSLAPPAPSNSNSVLVPNEREMGTEDSCTDLSSFTAMPVEPSSSAEKRILELVAEGGEDAIKPSPTRTIVTAGDNKRKLELAMSASGLQRKKEKVASSTASIAPQPPAVREEEPAAETQVTEKPTSTAIDEPTLVSSATMIISPSPAALVGSPTRDIVPELPKDEQQVKSSPIQQVASKKTISPPKVEDEKNADKIQEEAKKEESRSISMSSTTDKLTSLSLSQQPPNNQTPTKPKKFSIPGSNVGNVKEQFERRASLTTTPELKRNVSKPVSKIAKPKAQSEDRELSKPVDNGTVRLQQIGIEPPQTSAEEAPRGGVKKTESEPTQRTTPVDPTVLLEDARRSLQNSMAKLVEERMGEEGRKKAARDVISSVIRTGGKPPMPYGRSSSAGVTSLSSMTTPPQTPPATALPQQSPKLYRTEAHHVVEDHRNRGVSVERIIPIHVSNEETPSSPPRYAPPPPPPSTSQHAPLRRLTSTESAGSACGSEMGEPIKKSSREFIIPIAVEGKGYVTPRQRSVEKEPQPTGSLHRRGHRNRLRTGPMFVSGGESDEEDDTHMHRLRSSRAARAESVSSGEEDEEDEGFHLLTAENLFSTLLHRVRALTNRLNGEEGPGFSQHPHSLFNNLQSSPFFNSPHLPRRHLITHRHVESKRSVSETREGWGSRDLHADLDSMFNKSRQQMPRGSSRRSSKQQNRGPRSEEKSEEQTAEVNLGDIQLSEKEIAALSGLTPALSRRLQRSLLAAARLPPAAARELRRTLSLHTQQPERKSCSRSLSANADTPIDRRNCDKNTVKEIPSSSLVAPDKQDIKGVLIDNRTSMDNLNQENTPKVSTPQFCTLPRLKRYTDTLESVSPTSEINCDFPHVATECNHSRESSVRSTPDRPLLSKYFTPERNLSLDDSYSSDGGSLLSEPSYIAAYGPPSVNFNTFRRHSMRLSGDRDQPRKRISRFLRSDFFENPPDENYYAKQKKEKETQKILKEIREKKNRCSESSVNNPLETIDGQQMSKDETTFSRKCLSPLNILSGKERSRSITPFFPILDNIKESILDSSIKIPETSILEENINSKVDIDDDVLNKESKLIRPKSYPVKTLDSFGISTENESFVPENVTQEDNKKESNLNKESKLMRPKSYPTSSPSQDKIYFNRSRKKEEKDIVEKQTDVMNSSKNDVEVTFSVSLPKRNKAVCSSRKNSTTKVESEKTGTVNTNSSLTSDIALISKKHSVISKETIQNVESKIDHTRDIKFTEMIVPANLKDNNLNDSCKSSGDNDFSKKDKIKLTDTEQSDKKATIKKKIIRKVSSKSKADIKNNQDNKDISDKKKILKKVKSDIDPKTTTSTPKKKSVLQCIGHKLEKLTSSKSTSPEKLTSSDSRGDRVKTDKPLLNRMQREQSVPVNTSPTTESKLIKRAVTITDIVALETQKIIPNKTAVSKVLGLFKKFEPKDKVIKPLEKTVSEPATNSVNDINDTSSEIVDKIKPKRPTSLLLNGLGRKNKGGKTVSDSIAIPLPENSEQAENKESEAKKIKNTLKLDFSKLPRVKKLVPLTPTLEPQIINNATTDKDNDKNDADHNMSFNDILVNKDNGSDQSRSRSRSKSDFSNSDVKSDRSSGVKASDKIPLSSDNASHHPTRNRESTSPDKDGILDRIRRKSYYQRFNEKPQRRKSSLVGPGAPEYDPVARIHSPPTEVKYDVSPTSPALCDLSPGFSITSDISPSTERYKSILSDLATNNRASNLKYDSMGLNNKVDTYRSLDRNDLRKHSTNRSYLDYEQPSSLLHRYARTKSLLEDTHGTDEKPVLGIQRDHLKYNRTLSMYTPGNYATYRPMRTRNSAIILKESEKEPSPENVLDKIRQRKNISISVTRKPDLEKTPVSRPGSTAKSEGDVAECTQKSD